MNAEVYIQQIEKERQIKKEFGLGYWFDEAAGHDYNCKCDYCREWWSYIGRDPDTGLYGTFTDDEINRPAPSAGQNAKG